MAPRSRLACSVCGGDLYLDVSRTLKLMTPSFVITADGIQNPMLDIVLTEAMTPVLFCPKCKKEFMAENHNHISAKCVICGDVKPADDMVVTAHVSPICGECLDQIKNGIPGQATDTMRSYTAKAFRTYPLITSLFKNLKFG